MKAVINAAKVTMKELHKQKDAFAQIIKVDLDRTDIRFAQFSSSP